MIVPETTDGTTDGVTVGDGELLAPPFEEQAVNVAASANARKAGSNTMRVRESMSPSLLESSNYQTVRYGNTHGRDRASTGAAPMFRSRRRDCF